MKFKFTEDKKRKKLNDVIYKDNVGNMEISNNFFNNSTDSSAMSEEKTTEENYVEDVEDQDLGRLSHDMETDKTELEIDDTMLDLLDLKYIDEDFIPTGYMMYDLRMTEEFDEEDELALLEDASGKEYMVVASNKETPVKFDAGDMIPSTGDGIIFASRFPTREDAISFARERRQKNPEEEVDIYSGRVTAMNEFKCSVAMNEGGLENLRAIGRAIKDGVKATKQSIANYSDDKYEQKVQKQVKKDMYNDMKQNAEMFADKWKASEKELKQSKNREVDLKNKLKDKSQITVMDVDKKEYEKEKAELEKNPNPQRVDIGGRFVDKNKVRAVVRADDNTLRQLTVDQFNKLTEKEKENFVGWSSLNAKGI